MSVILYNKEGNKEKIEPEFLESYLNAGYTLEKVDGVQQEEKREELREEKPREDEELFQQLRLEAKEKGVKGWHSAKSVEKLREMIERAG